MGDPLVKILFRGGKIRIFWQGSPGKSHIPGAKYHIIGVASTADMKNIPRKEC